MKIIKKHHLLDLAMDFMPPPDVDSSQEREIERAVRVQINLHQGQRTNRDRLTKLVGLWLACGIDNGLDWMIRFPERIRQNTEAKEGLIETGTLGCARDERLVDAAASLLGHFGEQYHSDITTAVTPTATDAADIPINPDNTSSDDHTPMFQLTKFLTTILDPRIGGLCDLPHRLPFTVANSSQPDTDPAPTSDCAITFSTFSRAWIAVPAALAHLSAWRKRAWVVEPFDLHDTSDDTAGQKRGLSREFGDRESWVDAYPFLHRDSAKDGVEGGEGNRVGWRVWGTRTFAGAGIWPHIVRSSVKWKM
ncbi:hypothetical protein OQA88_7971 [Cercophora sp. LCS_1]